ncbi:MAG TPA: transglutaminase family protein [Chitinophagales bacterium]|nr:transglutaminase family protein [Chitinophagales bacterium]
MTDNFEAYLRPTRFIDSDNPDVIAYAKAKTSAEKSDKQKAIDLYYAVRDEILYDPNNLILKPEAISASITLKHGRGYCVEKSLLLCAVGRVWGIPSRLGFSIVKNHLATQKFIDMLRSDKFVFHGYNEFWLDNKWVKCTPAFNKTLCDRFGVAPLEFDGEHDSIFQEHQSGKQYMEYLHEYGQFDDLPFDLFVQELKLHYPHLFEDVDAKTV